ncbi:MAG: hypothetical protein JWO97_3758 [Acidobacteria bacterium]|nr:hypothetical protein [Acidobacteriota bacterium]
MRRMKIAIRAVAVVLVVIGVLAAILRIVYLDDLAVRSDPVRNTSLRRLSIVDPHAGERLAQMRRFDGSYAVSPKMTLLHVAPGALLLVLMLMQFSSRIRRRFPSFHRWSGRVTVIAGLAITIAALFFAIGRPFAGVLEAIAAFLFGGLFVVSLLLGFLAARRRDFAVHREWMIRASSVAFGISSVRLTMSVLDPLMTMAGFSAPAVFDASLWSGWIVMLLVAELWIRATSVRGGSALRARPVVRHAPDLSAAVIGHEQRAIGQHE